MRTGVRKLPPYEAPKTAQILARISAVENMRMDPGDVSANEDGLAPTVKPCEEDTDAEHRYPDRQDRLYAEPQVGEHNHLLN